MQNTVAPTNKHLFREYYTTSEKTKPLCSRFFNWLVLLLIYFMWSYQMHSQNIHTSNGIKCTKIINKNIFHRISAFLLKIAIAYWISL